MVSGPKLRKIIMLYRTPAGSWNKKQFIALGLTWKDNTHGWIDRLCQFGVSEENVKKFIEISSEKVEIVKNRRTIKVCPKCNSEKKLYAKSEKGCHIGLYCGDCYKWLDWIPHNKVPKEISVSRLPNITKFVPKKEVPKKQDTAFDFMQQYILGATK